MIINPGSGPIRDGNGWTNTEHRAQQYADEWLRRIVADGIVGVTLDPERAWDRENGRWKFRFRHAITGVVVELEHHGIDNLDAYSRANIFTPRVYWNGSSSSDPSAEDWLAPGFCVEHRLVLSGHPTPEDDGATRQEASAEGVPKKKTGEHRGGE